jgi:hypothetical protein
MEIPIDEILDTVREPLDPETAFNALRDLCKRTTKLRVWDSVRTPDTEADIATARLWLDQNISEQQPSGVYLGLDTLNENDGWGKNVGIGFTAEANPRLLRMDWAYCCEGRGEDHLIRGLYEVHKACDAFGLEYRDSNLAEYVLYLGYSGIVFASALEKLAPRWGCLFVWGFHDGDLGFLARSSSRGVERLASFEGS